MVPGGDEERRPGIHADGVDGGAGAEQHFDDVDAAFAGGPDERGGAVLVTDLGLGVVI